MSTSRSLFLSAVLSGLVFSVGALPLVMLGSRPITIEIEEKPLLTGRIQNLASPYLGLVLGLSAGVGLVTLSLSEWRTTARKLNQMRDRVSDLENQLQRQEHQVESLKFSESRLHSQGLSFFLDPAHSALPAASTSTFTPVHPVSQSGSLHESSLQNQAAPQIEELMVALKQLTNQVEQLRSADGKTPIDRPINTSVNASARA